MANHPNKVKTRLRLRFLPSGSLEYHDPVTTMRTARARNETPRPIIPQARRFSTTVFRYSLQTLNTTSAPPVGRGSCTINALHAGPHDDRENHPAASAGHQRGGKPPGPQRLNDRPPMFRRVWLVGLRNAGDQFSLSLAARPASVRCMRCWCWRGSSSLFFFFGDGPVVFFFS